MEERMLLKFDYHLVASDPDVVILRRQDGSFVGAFSARGGTREGIVEAAKEGYRELIRAQAQAQWSFEQARSKKEALSNSRRNRGRH